MAPLSFILPHNPRHSTRVATPIPLASGPGRGWRSTRISSGGEEWGETVKARRVVIALCAEVPKMGTYLGGRLRAGPVYGRMLPFFTVCIFSLVGAYALAPAISERPLPLMIDAAFLLVLAAVGFAALLFG